MCCLDLSLIHKINEEELFVSCYLELSFSNIIQNLVRSESYCPIIVKRIFGQVLGNGCHLFTRQSIKDAFTLPTSPFSTTPIRFTHNPLWLVIKAL